MPTPIAMRWVPVSLLLAAGKVIDLLNSQLILYDRTSLDSIRVQGSYVNEIRKGGGAWPARIGPVFP